MNHPWHSVFAVAPLFLSAQATAAPTTGLPAPELSASAKYVILAAKARSAGSASNDAATKAKDEAVSLAAQRKQLVTQLSTQRRDFKRHLTSARSASQRYQQRVQAGTAGPADQALLETARQEYTAATELAASIRNDTKKLRTLEETLSKRLTDAAVAATSAQARPPEAQQQTAELNTLVTRARSDSQSAGTALSSLAVSARSKAALAPATYPARRTKLAADDTKLQAAVALSEMKLATAEQQLGRFANEERLAKQSTTPGPCDVKRVDWANRVYPEVSGSGAFVLIKGKSPSDEYNLLHELGKVVFVDMNGNDSLEALVPIQWPGGPRGGQYLTVFVYEADSTCIAKEVHRIDGGPYADYGSLKGKSYVIERQAIGENSMPADLELLIVTFKAGKYVEAVTEPPATARR